MAGMRERIRMDAAEQAAFLAEPHKMSLATIGRDGLPHLVTMYYAPWGEAGATPTLTFWSYRTSQKARNLARDPRCSALVEAGEHYGELRGVSLSGPVREVEGVDEVLEVGIAVYGRYVDADVSSGPMLEYLRDQATKRSAWLLEAERVATWDHRKLAPEATG